MLPPSPPTHGLEGAGGEEPVHDLDGVLAEGFGLALLKAGSETIQGTGKGANHDFGHPRSSEETCEDRSIDAGRAGSGIGTSYRQEVNGRTVYLGIPAAPPTSAPTPTR